MIARTANRPLSALLLLAGLAFVLTAAKCQSDTEFVDFVDEICTDGKDNDDDGKSDCDDADCSGECAVQVVLYPPGATSSDTLKLSGTHKNASAISVAVSTGGGQGGSATIAGADWSYSLTGVTTTGTHNLTVTATSAKGLKDTATATFERR